MLELLNAYVVRFYPAAVAATVVAATRAVAVLPLELCQAFESDWKMLWNDWLHVKALV